MSAPGAEGGYIDVSRGSVLPFYPNVISAKYENSYVAAVYSSRPRAERAIRSSRTKRVYEGRETAERGQQQPENITRKYRYLYTHADL